jgi:hypothetical protein
MRTKYASSIDIPVIIYLIGYRIELEAITLASSLSKARKSNRAIITSAQATKFHNLTLVVILPSRMAHISGKAILTDRYRNPSTQFAITK